jgi:primosomal protein N' (replication factor Y)
LTQLKQFFTERSLSLHGVTSSGKTGYIKLIEEYPLGETSVVFIAEIALTTQLVSRLNAYFGNKVAVFHSKYNNNERVEVWTQVLKTLKKHKL